MLQQLSLLSSKPNPTTSFYAKRANFLVASLKSGVGPSPCVRNVHEKNVNARDSERNGGLKQRLRSTARCEVEQESKKRSEGKGKERRGEGWRINVKQE